MVSEETPPVIVAIATIDPERLPVLATADAIRTRALIIADLKIVAKSPAARLRSVQAYLQEIVDALYTQPTGYWTWPGLRMCFGWRPFWDWLAQKAESQGTDMAAAIAMLRKAFAEGYDSRIAEVAYSTVTQTQESQIP